MTELRTITEGLRFPEGPIAMPDGSVVLVEIEAARLTRVNPDGSKETIAETGGGPNGAAIGPDGACYICNNGGFNWEETPERLRPVGQGDYYSGGRIERVDMETGEVNVLYTHCGDNPLKGPNDIVFDEHGGFYFTDLGKVRDRDMDRGGLYYALPDGSSITEVAFPIITPNGVGLSPDDKTVYVAETETSRLWSYEVTGPGELKTEPFPSVNGGKLVTGLPGYQRFDSMALDSAGNICVGTLIRGGVTVISPDGQDIEHIPTPDMFCTNICFGGQNLQTAYLTQSFTGKLIALDWPRPGLPLHFLNK
ncbi:MAG: gluconolaconase [Rhodospirillaceae bacterium]|jgi:gluconolactonase|nr:gluconolaconase [Rhodospirillaceae bacterium]|tara:strand:+ start:298 stop:1221 length:924 start_codon:yes stop_codon:yes gene_type:complete